MIRLIQKDRSNVSRSTFAFVFPVLTIKNGNLLYLMIWYNSYLLLQDNI